MNTMIQVFFFSVIATTLGLVSCATVSKVGQGSMAFTSKISQLSAMAVDKISPTGVQVVEVREKDLKKLPSGQERALAFENTRKHRFWFFGGPVDFKETTLPESGGQMDGSLLPPKAH